MKVHIEVSADLYKLLETYAQTMSWSVTDTASELVRRGLWNTEESVLPVNPSTGFPQIDMGRVITLEDVHASEDEEMRLVPQPSNLETKNW